MNKNRRGGITLLFSFAHFQSQRINRGEKQMNKEKLLVKVKHDMLHVVGELTYKNLSDTRTHIENYFSILGLTKDLPNIPEKEEEVLPEAPILISETPIVTEQIEERDCYKFERRIKGGYLTGLNAFVPEKIVRELELTTGDIVYADRIQSDAGYSGPPQYDFQVKERTEKKPNDQRVQLNRCMVQKDELTSKFYVDKDWVGNRVRLPDVPGEIYLPEEDCRHFALQVDDVIDIAYDPKNINYMRIIWRHSMNYGSSEPTESELMLAARQKREKTQKEYDQIFEGKRILMVGFEPGRADMREEVERRGGEFEWASGREVDTRLHSMIRKSDAVVFMLEHVGHRGTIRGTDFALESRVPHASIHSFGRTEFVRAAQEAMESITA